MRAPDSPHPDPLPHAGEGTRRGMLRLIAATVLAAAFGSPAAFACPDLESAPSSRWSFRSEHGARFLVTPCGDSFYSIGVNVLDGEIPQQPVPGHERYDWRRYYPTIEAWRADTE